MEAFSLLKYWRGSGGGGGGDVGLINAKPNNGVATIVTTATTTTTDDDENDASTEGNDNDDGPFFDIEFSVDDEEEAEDGEDKPLKSDDDDGEEEEREFKFTLSSPSGSSNDRTDGEPNLSLSLSPSDDLFFKGKLVPIESSSIVFTPSDQANPKPQFPVSSLLKSATKFRVFMLNLKKSKSNGNNNAEKKTESNVESAPTKTQGKFFTVKFKVEEVPIVSLFTRDNSSRVSNKPAAKQSSDNETTTTTTTTTAATTTTTTTNSSSPAEEKRFKKEVMQKYLKIVKPLYVRVSRRYGEKMRLSGHVSLNGSLTKPVSPSAPVIKGPENPTVAAQTPVPPEAGEAPVASGAAKGGLNLPAGLRVVCKHLGKSRSASAAAISSAPAAALGTASSRRRDDSLIQQQDGIQSAILHCKRSFNAVRDSEAALLARCGSDPSNEKKSLNMSRKSSDGTIQRS